MASKMIAHEISAVLLDAPGTVASRHQYDRTKDVFCCGDVDGSVTDAALLAEVEDKMQEVVPKDSTAAPH